MKTIITVFMLAAFYTIGHAQSSHGTVGDVKYSILEEEQFRIVHDSTWVLMDGRTISGTALNQLINQDAYSLPDARGVFIRGMNMNRDAATGDTDGNRPVGKWQVDGIKKHVHKFRDAWFAEVNCGWGGTLGSKSSDSDNVKCEEEDTTYDRDEDGLINETRPRNIALYIYIKVNETSLKAKL